MIVFFIVLVFVFCYYGNLLSLCSFKRRSFRGDFFRLSEEFWEVVFMNVLLVFFVVDDDDDSGVVVK